MKKFMFVLSLMLFMGLYGCANLRGWIGGDPDGDGDAKGSSHFPLTRPATGKRVFIYDPQVTAWAVYDENGHRQNTGRGSGGANYCPDVGRACRTIVGTFRILDKKGAECTSSKYPIEEGGGGPMPYCMHFSPIGYAVHASEEVPSYNASHGCIRVNPRAAQWLHDNFLQVGSTVIVKPY